MNNFSIVIPTYKSYKYLNLCLESILYSATFTDVNFQVIVACDGTYEEFVKPNIPSSIRTDKRFMFLDLPKYGMAKCINYGVYMSTYDNILILNDDNVCHKEMFTKLKFVTENQYFGVNLVSFPQIEPRDSIFNHFMIKNLGEDDKSFQMSEFLSMSFSSNEVIDYLGTFPFMIKRSEFMRVNGFDIDYPSPFVVDWDFFVKVNSIKLYKGLYFYHFSSKSSASPEVKETEKYGHEYFKFKWGKYGQINKNQTKYL
jgi:glycosyltransferase involved in cell wall biosynthesis